MKWSHEAVSALVFDLKASCPNRIVTRSKWIDLLSNKMSLSESLSYWSVFMQARSSVLGLTGDWIDLSSLGILLLCQCYPNARVRADSSHRSEALAQSLATTAVASAAPNISPVSRSGTNRHLLLNMHRILRDNTSILQFVIENASLFVGMLALDSKTGESGEVNLEQVQKLEFLLNPGPNLKLAEIILGGKSSISCAELVQTLATSISWDNRVFPQMDASTGPATLECRSPSKNNLLVTNQSRVTILRDDPDYDTIDSLYVINCNESSLYIAGPVKNAIIVGCSECEIILLATTGSVIVSHCDKLTIRAVASSVRLDNSTECVASVYITKGLILGGDTRGVQLAPFNVTYTNHSSVLVKAGLYPDPAHATIWSQPLTLTLSDSPYVLMSPERFRLTAFPEFSSTGGSHLAVSLPQVYAEAISKKIKYIESLRSDIVSSADDVSAAKMSAVISGHFREWVSSSNKVRTLVEVIKLRSN